MGAPPAVHTRVLVPLLSQANKVVLMQFVKEQWDTLAAALADTTTVRGEDKVIGDEWRYEVMCGFLSPYIQ